LSGARRAINPFADRGVVGGIDGVRVGADGESGRVGQVIVLDRIRVQAMSGRERRDEGEASAGAPEGADVRGGVGVVSHVPFIKKNGAKV
jgi:hypothetical protein